MAAFVAWPQYPRQIVDAARRECETFRRGRQPGRVGNGRHFDRALGAVEERVEHLRIEIAGGYHFPRETVVRPHGVGRRAVILGQIFGALAGGDHLESRRAAPVDHLADQRRLIAIRQRINDARFACALRQQRAGKRIGLDVDHDDMFAMLTACLHVADPGEGIARRIDDDLDFRRANQRGRIVGDMRGSGLQRLGE